MLVIWHRRKGLETTRLTLSMIRKVQTSTLFSGYTVVQLIISPMVGRWNWRGILENPGPSDRPQLFNVTAPACQ